MIVKPLDLAVVQQINNVSDVKHIENQKPMMEQQAISTQIEKNTEYKSEQVNQKDNADNDGKKFDARDKSSNEYKKDAHNINKKKNKEDGTVTLKGQSEIDFDIKI